MSNLATRTITGIVLVVLVIAVIIAGQYPFALLFLAFTMIGLWEFYTLVERAQVFPNKPAGLFAGVILFVSNALVAMQVLEVEWLLLNFLSIFVIFLLELYRKDPNPFTNIAFTFFGLVYVAVPFSLLNYFPNPGFEQGVHQTNILLGFFFLVWVNETAAYLIGSGVGKHKLFKRVSPNKTWEGAIGGAVFAPGLAYPLSMNFAPLSLFDWTIIAYIVVVFGIYGDLFESMLKRSLNTKDSGTILPGHGGVLDRFDGVFIAAPFVFVYLLLTI